MGNCFVYQLPGDSNSNRIGSRRPSSQDLSRHHQGDGGGISFSSSNRSAGFLVDADLAAGDVLAAPKLITYTYIELKNATRNFKPDMVLGEGGFGTVYKGFVEEKTLTPSARLIHRMMVAIKKLNPQSLQGFEEWQSEVNFLGMLSHPNLVKLLGYCWEQKELLLVYEFVERGSLENHLFRKIAAVGSLSWDLRLKIAAGAAKGLAFLHNSEKKVIYRDFKAANILLDGGYNAKISDFGLAKTGPLEGDSHVTTRVMGTRGYAAPEYLESGHLYVKSDVYGFGVVLLEMLTGLRALDPKRPFGKQSLVDWMKPLLSHRKNLKLIMDAQMEGQYSLKAAWEVAQLTTRCLELDHKKRPAMAQVVECLERIAAVSK